MRLKRQELRYLWPDFGLLKTLVAKGLPMGLQIIGKPQGDAAVLQLARAYEEVAQEVLARRPPEQGGLKR